MLALIIEFTYKVKNLTRSLIIYSGLVTALSTKYFNYIAYTRPSLKHRVFNFNFDEKSIPFQIERRGTHEYILVKGSFKVELADVLTSYSSELYECYKDVVDNLSDAKEE